MRYQKTLENELKTSDDYLDNFEEEIRKTDKDYDRSKMPACIEHEQGYHDALTFALDEYKKRVTSKAIAHIIRKFVRRNFGDAEAKDPSWNIKLLATEIANNL